MHKGGMALKNITSNIAAYVVKLLLGVAAVPVCMHAFGAELYGLFLIGFGLSSSLTAFDLGASKSAFRFSVEYQADNDKQKYTEAINSAISLSMVAAAGVAITMIIIGLFSDTLFHLSPTVSGYGMSIFICAAVNTILLTIQAMYIQLLNAHDQFHVRNAWQYIPITGNILLLIWISSGRLSILPYCLGLIGTTGISLLIDLLLTRHAGILSGISFRFTLKRNVSTGYTNASFIHAAISFLSIQADRLIIGSVLNVQAVTTYTIITKPYFLLRGLVASGYPIFQPSLSALYLRGDLEAYRNFSRRVIRSAFMVVFCISLFLCAFFYPLLEAWVQTSAYHPAAIWGMLSLAIACLAMLYTPHYRTLVHSHALQDIVRFSYISVPVNVALSVILTHYLGFQGVIIGTAVQIAAEGIYVQYLAKRHMQISRSPLSGTQWIMCILLTLAALAISRMMYSAELWHPATYMYMALSLLAMGYICYRILIAEKPFHTPIPSGTH